MRDFFIVSAVLLFLILGSSISNSSCLIEVNFEFSMKYQALQEDPYIPASFVSQVNSSHYIVGIATDSTGNIYGVGKIETETQQWDLLLVKWNSKGHLLWTRTWGCPIKNEWPSGIAIDSSGNIYTGGSTNYNKSTDSSLLIRWDSNGNQIWNRTSEIPDIDVNGINGISVDNNGDIYMIGESSYWLVRKWNAQGELIWNYSDGSEFLVPFKIVLDRDNNLYALVQQYYVHLMKWDSVGNLQENIKLYGVSGEPGYDDCDLKLDNEGNIYICVRNFPDPVLMKYDINGTEVWIRSCFSEIYEDVLDDQGNLVVHHIFSTIVLDEVGQIYILMEFMNTENGYYHRFHKIEKWNKNGELLSRSNTWRLYQEMKYDEIVYYNGNIYGIGWDYMELGSETGWKRKSISNIIVFAPDSDNDSLNNWLENTLGTDSLNPDTDSDAIPDDWEFRNGLDPLDPSDALQDWDGDWVSNLEEYQAGTDFRNWLSVPSNSINKVFFFRGTVLIGFLFGLVLVYWVIKTQRPKIVA